MPREPRPIGPDTFALIEDARVDLLRAVLVAREGENEPDFKLPSEIPDPNDDEAVDAFREQIIAALSEFDQDELRPAEQRSRRIRALADGKGVASLTTIVEQQLDDEQSQEFGRQPDQLCRSIWTYLNARETFEDAESFHFARQFRDHGKLYDAFEVELENNVTLDAAAIDEAALATNIKEMLELKPEISCIVKALDLPATETHPASIMLIVRHGGPLSSVHDHRHDGRRGTIYYRPPNEATLIYTPSLRQIEVCADSPVVRQTVGDSFAEAALGRLAYRETLGRVWFNDAGYFRECPTYTLEPLRSGGGVLTLVSGMTEVQVTEACIEQGVDGISRQTLKGSDLLEMLAGRGSADVAGGRIVRAHFSIKYESGGRARTLKVCLPNVIEYDRERDGSIVDAFLRMNHFVAGDANEPGNVLAPA